MSANLASYCREIDNDILIEEVKARPALYDKNLKEYTDLTYKKSMWEEINKKLFSCTWEDLSETQKDMRRAEVLKRWNNIRSCFSRELKVLKDPLQYKRRKYVYFDKLLFLLDEKSQQFQDIDTTTSNTKSNSSFEKFEDESTHYFEKSPPVERKLKESKKAKAKQSRIIEQRKDVEKYVQYSINNLKEELASKDREDGSAYKESRIKSFDTDAETNFALSIVPSLKMVPLDKKIDAQMDILNVLKKYTNKMTFEYNMVKFEKEDEPTSEADDDSEMLSLYDEDK